MEALISFETLLRPEFLTATALIVAGALVAWYVNVVRPRRQARHTDAGSNGAHLDNAGQIRAPTPPEGSSMAAVQPGQAESAEIGRQVERGAQSAVTFASVAGLDVPLTELREVAEYLAAPERFHALGAELPTGVLLQGPSGCGKTLLAKALAGETGVAFHSVSAAEFVEQYVGTGAKRVRRLFEAATASAPAIVFIDELDAIGRQRADHDAGGQEFDHTLNQLLIELDGFDSHSGLVVVGATNRPELIDRALVRPGRFDRRLQVERPNPDARADILSLHAATRPVSAHVDWDAVAAATPGLSAAELAGLVNEAALLAARRQHERISRDDVAEAQDRIISGTPSDRRPRTPDEGFRLATHEAGHAVISLVLPDTRPPARVSIIDRAGGATTSPWQPDDDGPAVTAQQLHERLILLLGGRAAELEGLGEPSTRAENDLTHAATLARHMIERWAMTGHYELAGASRLPALEGSAQEVCQLLAWAECVARNILTHHHDLTHAVTHALTQQETLDVHELNDLAQRLGSRQTAPPANAGSESTTTAVSAIDERCGQIRPPQLQGV